MIPLIVVLVGLVMMAVEFYKPGRKWPKVATWWSRAILFNGMQAGAVLLAGILWDQWMKEHSLFSIASLGTTKSALVGYALLTFVYYWWHRARHQVPFLWRWFHQLHHSPQRIEIVTSFYKHPFELASNALISSTIMYLVLGLSPEGAAGATLLSGLAELFYHWNVKTPRWVGFFFQRPEMHCVHHEQGVHHCNYGDLPLWDMLFGTYDNPKDFDQKCGFAKDAELRVGDMLLGRDVQTKSSKKGKGVNKNLWIAVFLLGLGLAQMTGAILNIGPLKGVASATAASPAPKVFSSVEGMETFSTGFTLRWVEGSKIESRLITREIYRGLLGPYNRRNVWGAMLAYGPFLATNGHTQEMFDSITRHGLCGNAPILRELGINPAGVSSLEIAYSPREGTQSDLPLILKVECL